MPVEILELIWLLLQAQALLLFIRLQFIFRHMTKNKNQQGFSHILVLIFVVVLVAVGLVGWRVMGSKDKASNDAVSQQQSSSEESDIELQNLGLASLDSVLISSDATREYKSNGLKGFYVFGDKLSEGRINPNFEFASLKPGTKVVSAIDGVVAFIKEQTDSNDNEVFIQPKDGSIWTVGYDHLVNLAVKKGAAIKAGDVIGEPATQNNGMLRFEIQINKDKENETTHHCPSTLLAAGIKDKILGDLAKMQNDWESETGLELYDVSAQGPTGCLQKTMTPAQAEGR